MLNKTNLLEFSVIIPVYKRRKLAQEAIESVFAQGNLSQRQIEVVVVDDEDNAKKANKNKKFYTSLSTNIVYLRNKFEEGPGGARQTGLKAARGKFLTFLDSDDRLKPMFYPEMSKVLKDNRKLAGAVSFSDAIFDKGFSTKERIKLIPLMLIRDVSLYLTFLFNDRSLLPDSFYLCQVSHMMFRRSLIKGLKFNYDYRRGGEDWDFIVEASNRGKICILPKKLLYFRYSPSSLINRSENRAKKWISYRLLASRLPEKFKSGIFYRLFLGYIDIYSR